MREALAAQTAALAASRAPALRRSARGGRRQVALVGSRAEVADAIARHREVLRLTHLIARVQVPGAEPAEIEAALERLAELAADAVTQGSGCSSARSALPRSLRVDEPAVRSASR